MSEFMELPQVEQLDPRSADYKLSPLNVVYETEGEFWIPNTSGQSGQEGDWGTGRYVKSGPTKSKFSGMPSGYQQEPAKPTAPQRDTSRDPAWWNVPQATQSPQAPAKGSGAPTGYNGASAPKAFDAEWYLQKYPDVAKNATYGSRPEQHYKDYGKGEGRLPSGWMEEQKNSPQPTRDTGQDPSWWGTQQSPQAPAKGSGAPANFPKGASPPPPSGSGTTDWYGNAIRQGGETVGQPNSYRNGPFGYKDSNDMRENSGFLDKFGNRLGSKFSKQPQQYQQPQQPQQPAPPLSRLPSGGGNSKASRQPPQQYQPPSGAYQQPALQPSAPTNPMVRMLGSSGGKTTSTAPMAMSRALRG